MADIKDHLIVVESQQDILPGAPGSSEDIAYHAAQHMVGGYDRIAVDGLEGQLAEAQDAKSILTQDIDPALAPTDLQVLIWSVANNRWQAGTSPAPGNHASTHEKGGADELNLADMSGILVTPQNADKIQTRPVTTDSPTNGYALVWDTGIYELKAVAMLDHASRHETGGGDEITDILAEYIMLTDIDSAANNSVQKLIDDWVGHGLVSGGIITDAGAGKVDISAGVVFIKTLPTCGIPTGFVDFLLKEDLVLVDNQVNYVYAKYAGGTVTILATLTSSHFYEEDSVNIGVVFRQGTGIQIVDYDSSFGCINTLTERRFEEEATGEGFPQGKRVLGALTSSVGTRKLAVTEGVFWAGLNRFLTGAFDSSGTDTFKYFYRDGVGGHTEVPAQTQIDNLQYDDGSGALATLVAGRYGVHWEYMSYDGSCISIMYGLGNYTAPQAEAATPPTDIPESCLAFGILIGKIIVVKSSDSLEIQVPWVTAFGASGVTSHSELSGPNDDPDIQHISSAEKFTTVMISVIDSVGTLDTITRDIVVKGVAANYMLDLGDATTYINGHTRVITNASSEFIGVRSSDFLVWERLGPGCSIRCTLVNNDAAPGTWHWQVQNGTTFRGYEVQDDFIGGSGSGAAALADYWSVTVSGGGTVLPQTPLSGSEAGVRALDTGTETSDVAALHGDLSCLRFNGMAHRFVAKVNVPILSDGSDDFKISLGFGDSIGSGAHSDALAFLYDYTTSLNWQLEERAGGTGGFTATSIPVAPGYVWLSIEVNSAGTRADFWIGNVHVGTLNTDIPKDTNTLGYFFKIIKTVGTTARELLVDKFLYSNYKESWR